MPWKQIRGTEAYLHSFLTSPFAGVEQLAWNTNKGTPGTHWTRRASGTVWMFWRRGKSLVPARDWHPLYLIHYRHILHFYWGLSSMTPKKSKNLRIIKCPPPTLWPNQCLSTFLFVLIFFAETLWWELLLFILQLLEHDVVRLKDLLKLTSKYNPPTLEGSKWCIFILGETHQVCKTAKYQLKCLGFLLFLEDTSSSDT